VRKDTLKLLIGHQEEEDDDRSVTVSTTRKLASKLKMLYIETKEQKFEATMSYFLD
jgi:hypothetical protein